MAFKVKYLASSGPQNDAQSLERISDDLEIQGYGHIITVIPIVQGEGTCVRTTGFLILAKNTES